MVPHDPTAPPLTHFYVSVGSVTRYSGNRLQTSCRTQKEIAKHASFYSCLVPLIIIQTSSLMNGIPVPPSESRASKPRCVPSAEGFYAFFFAVSDPRVNYCQLTEFITPRCCSLLGPPVYGPPHTWHRSSGAPPACRSGSLAETRP